jgi:sugar lactone lactonase YvrE
VCLSVPVATSEPELESRTMKNKKTETKSRSGFGPTRHLISGVLCLAIISLICSSASAQNLFAVDLDNGNIDEFTPNGVRSTVAFGLNYPAGLAFDQAGNLFVADGGAIYKFTPAGVRTTFASGLSPSGLTFDSAGNLVVADGGSGAVYKFTPAGVRTTFASGLSQANGLAFDRAGNLFVSDGGAIYKFSPSGTRSTFASGFFYSFALAFDSRGNLFVADGGFAYDLIFGAAVYKFTPSGLRSTVASQNDQVRVIPAGLAIDSADNLFVAGGPGGSILKFTPSGCEPPLPPDSFQLTPGVA